MPQRVVGFLPVIPHPVTDARTVYTALKIFEDILDQLQQSKMAITCDEGVYHIAREVMLHRPQEFKNIVLCLGSFHMIKIVCGCIGKYIDGGGAETILVEQAVFGPNVIKSVLNGSHYERSVKGYLLLGEVIERMEWCEFLRQNDNLHKYEKELDAIENLNAALKAKNRRKSCETLHTFVNCSKIILNDFKSFKKIMC